VYALLLNRPALSRCNADYANPTRRQTAWRYRIRGFCIVIAVFGTKQSLSKQQSKNTTTHDTRPLSKTINFFIISSFFSFYLKSFVPVSPKQAVYTFFTMKKRGTVTLSVYYRGLRLPYDAK
jgi:hypothetical protein